MVVVLLRNGGNIWEVDVDNDKSCTIGEESKRNQTKRNETKEVKEIKVGTAQHS